MPRLDGLKDLCLFGGDCEDDFDVGRKRKGEAAEEFWSEAFSNVIQAIKDEKEGLFGRRHEGEEG